MKSFNSTRRPAIFFGIVMWLLSFVIAAFLIQLGGAIIADVPLTNTPITVEDYMDETESKALKSDLQTANKNLKSAARTLSDLKTAQNTARNEYQSARTDFENWIATRTATQSDSQNPEVVARTTVLENLNAKQRTAGRDVEAAQADVTTLTRKTNELNADLRTLRTKAYPDYERARNLQTLKTFLIRLAITLPLLLISAWLILKHRNSAYWPLYRGFVFFALFAFFVELVPYLPSYGGYLRSIVGIIVAIVAGKYIIAAMRRYLETKKNEESKSEEERRQNISYETALKKIASHQCPSCDRKAPKHKDQLTDFCVHCGFNLYNTCQNCDTRDNSFHKFCGTCGTSKTTPSPA